MFDELINALKRLLHHAAPGFFVCLMQPNTMLKELKESILIREKIDGMRNIEARRLYNRLAGGAKRKTSPQAEEQRKKPRIQSVSAEPSVEIIDLTAESSPTIIDLTAESQSTSPTSDVQKCRRDDNVFFKMDSTGAYLHEVTVDDLVGVPEILCAGKVYRKGRELGSGGYGIVHLYTNEDDAKDEVAVKFEFTDDLVHPDESEMADASDIAFKNSDGDMMWPDHPPEEAEIAQMLKKTDCNTVRLRYVPIIVQIENEDDEMSTSFMYIMDKLDGTLKTVLERKSATEEEWLDYMEEIRKQLICLADNGFYYTDLKDANVLYCRSTKRVLLGDLGSADRLNSEFVASYPPFEYRNVERKGVFTLTTVHEAESALAWVLGVLLLSFYIDLKDNSKLWFSDLHRTSIEDISSMITENVGNRTVQNLVQSMLYPTPDKRARIRDVTLGRELIKST